MCVFEGSLMFKCLPLINSKTILIFFRTALNEVTQELAERVYRWKQIESLCGFSIINNKGLAQLESVLYRNSVNGRNLGFRGKELDPLFYMFMFNFTFIYLPVDSYKINIEECGISDYSIIVNFFLFSHFNEIKWTNLLFHLIISELNLIGKSHL